MISDFKNIFYLFVGLEKCFLLKIKLCLLLIYELFTYFVCLPFIGHILKIFSLYQLPFYFVDCLLLPSETF